MADNIQRRIDSANELLMVTVHYIRTSSHPSWLGRVRCRYCKVAGYANFPWMTNHGEFCKWKETWDLKNARAAFTYTYSTNTSYHYNANSNNHVHVAYRI